jgi:hypothetical protein
VTVTHYRVLLRGENFLINTDEKATLFGFYTTRFVKANDPEEAELLAVDLIRQDDSLRKTVLNEQSDPPMIFAKEIAEVDPDDVPESVGGYTFFSTEEEE